MLFRAGSKLINIQVPFLFAGIVDNLTATEAAVAAAAAADAAGGVGTTAMGLCLRNVISLPLYLSSSSYSYSSFLLDY